MFGRVSNIGPFGHEIQFMRVFVGFYHQQRQWILGVRRTMEVPHHWFRTKGYARFWMITWVRLRDELDVEQNIV